MANRIQSPIDRMSSHLGHPLKSGFSIHLTALMAMETPMTANPKLMGFDAKSRKKAMLVNILIGLVALIAVFIVIVALRSADFRVSRSDTISASPEVVFSHVNNLHRWDAWSPWEKIDPMMKKTFEGPDEGVGAILRWDGNGQVGAGSNTIIESRRNELIRFKLNMVRPFVGTNDVEFAFQPRGEETSVTWTMTGNLNFITKIMDLIIGMDTMVGGQFQSGLAQLKLAVESADTN
jgi:hypothetical protein